MLDTEVLIVGAGPVGLTLALTFARLGVRAVVVEDDETVCDGSRALGMSRRSIEIWQALGAADAIREHGLPWRGGRSFYRGRTILEFEMPDDPLLQFRPMLNLQQSHTERYLVQALERYTGVQLRWRTRLLSTEATSGGVVSRLQGPAGEQALRSRYLVACDGARSTVRQHLGLKLEGTSYEAAYVIADIQLQTSSPTERRCWFDPPSNPGLTILMHGQPDGVWRLDYQLGPHEDPQAAVRPENVLPRIDSHLKLIGETGDWSLQWSSVYRVHSRALADFRHGDVFFAGDAAHLMPIFGIRGLNSGVEDAWNLGWKLAAVLRGTASDRLLDSYSAERRTVFLENAALAERNAWFMTPPSDGVRLLRDATLGVALSHDRLAEVLNPRQAAYVPLRHSPLSRPDDPAFAAGPPPGDVAPDLPLGGGSAGATYLQAALGPGFSLLYFSEAAPDAAAADALRRLVATAGLKAIIVCRDTGIDGNIDGSDLPVITDDDGTLHRRFDAVDGTSYLMRPDHNVLARWRVRPAPQDWQQALDDCLQGGTTRASPASAGHATEGAAETAYRALAKALDGLPADRHALLLAKLALLLGTEVDAHTLQAHLDVAGRNLDD